MPYTTLISASELVALGGHAVIVDCRFDLADTSWGERKYTASHIPGAVYAHLDRDLSGTKTGSNGRHPLPVPGHVRAAFGRLGIGPGVQVVAYDQDTGMYAARLWWLLRWMGHTSVAVLDGGFAKWQAEGLPTTSGVQSNTRQAFEGEPNDAMLVDAADVDRIRSDAAWRLVDARAPERFRGEVEPLDPVAGHIPGAVNHFFRQNLDDAATFRSPSELRERIGSAVAGVAEDHIVCYCGSGVTAAHNLLALERAGIHGARLYNGSWSEWSSDHGREIATGA